MPRYVAFLRGVNVGGRGKVPMAGLRDTVAALGHEDVATYIQSGNVVFRTSEQSAAKLAAQLEDRIEATFGLRITVVLRSADRLADVLANNPFVADGADPKSLHVGFLADRPAAAAVSRLDPRRAPGDEFVVRGAEVYLRYPNGLGRSKLSADYLERVLGTAMTVRNWNTVTKLVEMSGRRTTTG